MQIQSLLMCLKKYDNVYAAMNLDNQPKDLRIPPVLPEKLVMLPFDVDSHPMEYSNCRVILDGILNATKNIGMINVATF